MDKNNWFRFGIIDSCILALLYRDKMNLALRNLSLKLEWELIVHGI